MGDILIVAILGVVVLMLAVLNKIEDNRHQETMVRLHKITEKLGIEDKEGRDESI